MPAVVVDIHSVVWYLTKNPSLSARAEEALDAATAGGHPILVPSICLVELTYLAEKGRLARAARDVLIGAIDHEGDPYELAALDRAVADALEFVPRDEVPDLPDRIIAATAIKFRVPLVSRDRRIRASSVETIW